MSVKFLLILILGAIALQAIIGLGLIVAAFTRAAAWGWHAAMANQPDGRWSFNWKLMVAGMVLVWLAVVEAMMVTLLPLLGFGF